MAVDKVKKMFFDFIVLKKSNYKFNKILKRFHLTLIENTGGENLNERMRMITGKKSPPKRYEQNKIVVLTVHGILLFKKRETYLPKFEK